MTRLILFCPWCGYDRITKTEDGKYICNYCLNPFDEPEYTTSEES